MKPKVYLILLLLCSLYSCKHRQLSENNFDDKIAIIENDPQLYLSKLDTTKQNPINNNKEATDFLLSALTLNYINNDYYPQKELLLKSIQIFKREKQVQQLLEAQYLLAGIYRNEKNLTNEVYTIEEAINTASRIDDKEWLFYLYSYMGDMYIKKYNTLKFTKYQTLANQCIKDIDYRDMSISTKVLAAKNLQYTEQYQSSYDKLKEIESGISKNNTYYNVIKRLQGISLYKMHQWDSCIESMEEASRTEVSSRHLFTCHSILTYCYYLKNDLENAEKHRKAAIKYDTNTETGVTGIEFYTLCAEFAKANHNKEEEIKCLNNVKDRYAVALDNISGESLDEAIQAYTHIQETRMYHKQIALYRYILIGFLLTLCVSLMVYIRIRKKQVYKILALQQQIDSLENLRNMKDEVKNFIFRDFEIAKKIAMLRATQQTQSAKFLKDLEKHNIIKSNDLLSTHWIRFYSHIDLSFDGFYSKLTNKYPVLNEKEIQLCCMLVSGFKTEEIAAIWMNSVFSVHKYKTNIRKKINAPEAADIVAFLREKLLLH
ncbi:LuxR C-terminal-related transcriptional regulator [uncultured Bacteroides sp.]|uniref:LuxR C-terminal-related transcriptional regulator n=1 Tax=uncultured Bacteroides sp. TaxID=162156 RepID=UPI002593AF60|nr:LuxR C-terminal-related transcriptional regulator [uncultured Bacteroides sp.]